MILTRHLCHKFEIPGSKQWQMLIEKKDPCWLCEREMKGYIFWTPGMQQKSQKILQLSLGEKQAIFQELEHPTCITVKQPERPVAYIPPPEEGRRPKKPEPRPEPVFKQDPVICGQFTDWKPRKMIPLFDFLQEKEPDDRKLDYRNMFEHLKANFGFGQHSDITKFEMCESYHLNCIEEAMKKREPEIFDDWQSLFEEQCKYRKPFFINSDLVRNMKSQYREIYVAPCFARSGRQTFVIQPGETADTLETYTSVIDFRQEVVVDPQVRASKFAQRVFKKQTSVFAKWKSDTEKVREMCTWEHDFLFWKVPKFVKDHD